VGLNSSLLLNLPVDNRGLIHENEVKNLKALADYLNTTFSYNYFKGQKVKTSSTFKGYDNKALIDDDKKTYWVSGVNDQNPTIEIHLDNPVLVNTFMIQEYLPMGQRVKSFYFEVFTGGNWEKVYEGSTIGNKRLILFKTQTIERARFTVNDKKAQIVISNIGLFRAKDLDY
jgi:alpha-L-fucosidase